MSTLTPIGVFPAAGRASRLGGQRKELLPVPDLDDPTSPTIAACDYLIRQFTTAGLQSAVVIRLDHKADVTHHLQTVHGHSLDFVDVSVAASASPCHSIDLAYSHVRERAVAFGFPDILLQPAAATRDLLAHLAASQADIVLGLQRGVTPHKWDRVLLDGDRVLDIAIKPANPLPGYEHGWSLAAWRPRFTEFLHTELRRVPATEPELPVGEMFRRAMAAGYDVRALSWRDGFALDIGTADDLAKASSLARH